MKTRVRHFIFILTFVIVVSVGASYLLGWQWQGVVEPVARTAPISVESAPVPVMRIAPTSPESARTPTAHITSIPSESVPAPTAHTTPTPSESVHTPAAHSVPALPESVILGAWSEETLADLMREARHIAVPADQVRNISERFLGTPYQGSTLTGDAETPEVFTVNLAGLDCFTYIDYVEALRSSDSFSGFKDALKNIRYRAGAVDFTARNHFFSDWPAYNSDHVRDVTREVGGDRAVDVVKQLNRKEDGTVFLPGIPVLTRTVTYIPVEHLSSVVGNLRTGDYVGSYTHMAGLDVTHTGILIKRNGTIYLRHASTRESIGKKVVDEDLLEYMRGRTGLVVYRPVQ